MTEGYTKLFNSIVTSSIWSEPDHVRIVWITMLAMSDKDGVIRSSVPGLARVSGVSLVAAEESLEKLLGPDPYSRTTSEEGRRIVATDGGWRLLNHAAYRERMSESATRERNAANARRYRAERKKIAEAERHSQRHCVTGDAGDISPRSPHTDADTDTDSRTKESKTETDTFVPDPGRAGNRFFKVSREEWDTYGKEIHLDDPGAPWDHYVSNGWKISGRAPMKCWKSALRNWKRNEDKFAARRGPFKPETKEAKEQIATKSFMP